MPSNKELDRLAQDVQDRTFPIGAVMTGQDALGSIGRATISVDGKTVRIVGPGEFFGEMALIDRSNRRAATDAELTPRSMP